MGLVGGGLEVDGGGRKSNSGGCMPGNDAKYGKYPPMVHSAIL